MKIRVAILAVFLISGAAITFAQSKQENARVNWLTWDQAMAKSKDGKKKILVDVYTSGCKWCEKMEEVTYQDPKIVKYINDNYYAVRFDAEYKEDLQYQGKTYRFVKNGKNGYHELGAALLNGRLSYPSTAFLNEDLNLIQAIAGYKAPGSFECILSYIGGNNYKNQPWSAYERTCQSPSPVLQRSDKPSNPANQQPSGLQRLIKNNKKK